MQLVSKVNCSLKRSSNNSSDNQVSSHLSSVCTGNKVNMFLFFLHSLDVFRQRGLFCVRVGGEKFQEFGETSSVTVVLDNSQLDAAIKPYNTLLDVKTTITHFLVFSFST